MGLMVGGAVKAAMGLYQIAQGNSKTGQAKKQAALNQRPTYQIAPEQYQNLALAQSMAGQGLSDSSLQVYNDQAQRGLSSSLSNILKGGGDVNTAGAAYSSYLNNTSKLSLINDQTQLGNLKTLIAARNQMTEERDKAFKINEYAPYADRAAAIYEMGKAGANETASGIGGIGQGVASFVFGGSMNADRNAIGGKKMPTGGSTDLVQNGDGVYTPSLTNNYLGGSGFNSEFMRGLPPDQRQTMFSLLGH